MNEWNSDGLHSGSSVSVRALKADGSCYRWWTARVERITLDELVTLNRIGDVVEGADRGWKHRHHARNFYWPGRPYNLAEVYERDGRLKQLYVHIASVPSLDDHALGYVDLELDVIWRPGQEPRVADQDEFEAAAARYGYSAELQEACWRAVDEALGLVESWGPYGLQPARPGRRHDRRGPASGRVSTRAGRLGANRNAGG